MDELLGNPLAILTSDWHLRSVVPVSRAETDWYSVMKERMNYLKDMQFKYDCPIIVAGDLFNNWNPSSELISWCLDNMPTVYAIPGQHDLAQHRWSAIQDAGYGVLCKTGKVINLPVGEWYFGLPGLAIWAMPWNQYELPNVDNFGQVRLGVLHKYVWATKETAYIGASDDESLSAIASWSRHFDAVVIGDNHIPWKAGKFFNHGSLFSMTKAQLDHQPRVGLLHTTGAIELLPCTESPQWQKTVLEEKATVNRDMDKLMLELSSLDVDSLSMESVIQKIENECAPDERSIFQKLREQLFRAA